MMKPIPFWGKMFPKQPQPAQKPTAQLPQLPQRRSAMRAACPEPDRDLLEVISRMPELSHYPDRSKPFNIDECQVCQWLFAQPAFRRFAWQWAFDMVRRNGWVELDSKTRNYKGNKNAQVY
jgi:hypothetical protein